MKKQPTRLEYTLRMRAWRNHKGGLKPPAPPAAPTVMEHWLGKWRESMEERGTCRATVVTETGHTRKFVRWCHARGIRDPSWISTGLVQTWLADLEGEITRWGTPLSCSSIDVAVGCARRFLGFRVIGPCFRVNLCGIVCGKPVAASMNSSLLPDSQGVAGIVLDDGGTGGI